MKINKLFPIVGLASIASTPFFVSCSCSTNNIFLTNPETVTIYGDPEDVLMSNKVSLSKNTYYTAYIDMSDYTTYDEDYELYHFVLYEDVETSSKLGIFLEDASIEINGVEQTQVYKIDDVKENKFMVYNNITTEFKVSEIVGGPGLQKTDKVKIKFKIKESVKNYYLYFVAVN